jgi:hypothetical protein
MKNEKESDHVFKKFMTTANKSKQIKILTSVNVNLEDNFLIKFENLRELLEIIDIKTLLLQYLNDTSLSRNIITDLIILPEFSNDENQIEVSEFLNKWN